MFNKNKCTFSSSINVIKIALKLEFGFKTNLKDNNLYKTFEFNLLNQGWATSLVGGQNLLKKIHRGPH